MTPIRLQRRRPQPRSAARAPRAPAGPAHVRRSSGAGARARGRDRRVPRVGRVRVGDSGGAGSVRSSISDSASRRTRPGISTRSASPTSISGRYDDALASYRAGAGVGSRGRRRRRRNHPAEQHRQRPLHARPLFRGAPRCTRRRSRTSTRRTSEGSRARLRRMTISNLAVLHQRLGADQRALDLYAQIATGETMRPSEEAQLLDQSGLAPPPSRRSGQGDADLPPGAGAVRPRRSTAMARSAPGATSASRTPWT